MTNDGSTFSGQLIGVDFVWVFVTSFIAWYIIKALIGLRVSEEDEAMVDLAECGMEAYPEFTSSKVKFLICKLTGAKCPGFLSSKIS